jgi:hypothetical protein
MSSSDKKDGPPRPPAPSFDPAMMTTLPLPAKVTSPFGPRAPEAPGFGVEDTRRGFEKGEKARTPAGLLEKTEILSPEERKHGRPSGPKKADSPSKVAKADSPSKIARRGSPSKITKPKAAAPGLALMKTAVMKTPSLPGSKRRPEAPPRYPGLVETTQPMHAKRKPSRGKAFDPRQMRTAVLAPAEPAKGTKAVVPEPEVLKVAPRMPSPAVAVAPVPQRANEAAALARAGGGVDAALAQFLELADAALSKLTIPPG